MMSCGAFLYSTRLVSKIELRKDKRLEVYTHTIPFGGASESSKEIIKIGECEVELSKSVDPLVCLSPGSGYQPFKRKDDVLASYLLDVENCYIPNMEVALESLVFGRQSKVRDFVEGRFQGGGEVKRKKEKRKRYNPKAQMKSRKS